MGIACRYNRLRTDCVNIEIDSLRPCSDGSRGMIQGLGQSLLLKNVVNFVQNLIGHKGTNDDKTSLYNDFLYSDRPFMNCWIRP